MVDCGNCRDIALQCLYGFTAFHYLVYLKNAILFPQKLTAQKKPPKFPEAFSFIESEILDPAKPAAGVRGHVLYQVADRVYRNFVRNGYVEILFYFNNNIYYVQGVETEVAA